MPKDIILQLKTNEYEDEFFSPQNHDTDESELWQQEACNEIIYFLKKAGNEAKEYSTQHISNKKIKATTILYTLMVIEEREKQSFYGMSKIFGDPA